MMDQLIAGFTKQLSEALEIGKNAQLAPYDKEIKNILVSGLGGSGIGGNLAGEFIGKQLKVPMQVNKDYFLPRYINENTLVIISSYSGNTEETLQAFTTALEKNAHIVCITSNGKILEKAKEKNIDHIIIPGGMPPRACLGYSLVQQLFVLKHFGLTDDSFISSIEQSIQLLDQEENNIKDEAKSIAGNLSGKLPVIYVCADMEAVAIRYRQQFNENGKILCWHHVIPEMNHNELVGWRKKDDNLAVLLLRNKDDYARNRQRIDICKKIISEYTPHIIEIFSKGSDHIQKALYLIHLGDWLSFYLAQNKNMDAVEVKVIDHLKGKLATFNAQ